MVSNSRQSSFRSISTFWIIAGTVVAVAAPAIAQEAPAAKESKQALLVGCTTYIHRSNISPLNGPRNDVPAMARLLVGSFGFREADIQKLYDWPADPAARPTYANIKAGFERLAANAQPGGQVAIFMSGHGTQVPIPEKQTNPLDPRNPEPDGKDEIFLPSDVKSWSAEGVENAIRDDDIGRWLDAIRAKGADVWIIFDCCHSGSMSRGTPNESADADTGEVPRTVDPTALGVPEALLTAKTTSAVVAPAITFEQGTLEHRTSGGPRGRLVAFYAAQAYEEAPDLPRPSGAAKKPENFYGLLTYSLNQVLLEQRSALTYRDLARAITGRYRAERGGRAPTPLFVGDSDKDLDHVVLGSEHWQPAAINLRRQDDKLQLDAGEMLGITPGSILAVLRRPGPAEENNLLGYVSVTSTAPAAATAEPIAYAGQPALDLKKLPEFSPCKLVRQAVGDMRTKLLIRPSTDDAAVSMERTLRSTLNQLPGEVRALVEVTDDVAAADFELVAAEPSRAAREFNVQSEKPVILLLTAGSQHGTTRTVHAHYPLDPKTLPGHLERDIKKLFTWRNLWRVAGKLGTRLGPEDMDVKLEVAAVAGEKDQSGGKRLDLTHVPGGQWLEVRMRNEGLEDYWVTLLFAGADFSIDVWYSDSIRRGESFPPLRAPLDDSTPGAEGFIVLAVPMRAEKNQPRFTILKQLALGQDDTGQSRAAPQTPFGELLTAAALGGGTRNSNADLDAATNPSISSWSWVTVPRNATVGR